MPPNPKCIVCSAKPEVIIKIDTAHVTVKQFRDDVLIKALNMIEPDVTVDSKGVILISSEEGETDCNNDKTLAEMDVVDGCILKVDDFFQNYELTVIILHKEMEREGALFDIIADPESLKADASIEEPQVPTSASKDQNGESPSKKPRNETAEDDDDDVCMVVESDAKAEPSAGQSGSNGSHRTAVADDDDDICIIEDDDDVVVSPIDDVNDAKKRKTEESLGEPSSKRSKVENEDNVILVEED